MLTTIWFWLWHKHDWEIIETTSLMKDDKVVGRRYYKRCKQCSKHTYENCW